jgi:hypothetical protein
MKPADYPSIPWVSLWREAEFCRQKNVFIFGCSLQKIIIFEMIISHFNGFYEPRKPLF